MKRFLLAASIGCAGVICGFATEFENLKLGTNEWFRASVSGSSPVLVGGTINAASDVVSYGNNVMEIDSDISSPVTFAANNNLTQSIASVVVNLDAATVPNSLLLNSIDSGRIAFALAETAPSQTNFCAWVGSSWIPLTSSVIPEFGDSYELIVRIDNRNSGHKVQFSVVIAGNETELRYNGNSWLDYAGSLQSAMSVMFVGCGKVKSFNANQLQILAEVVVVGDVGMVSVKEEDVAAFESSKGTYGSVEALLAAPASEAIGGFRSTGVKVAEAYALGMIAKNGSSLVAVNNGELKMKAAATAANATSIKLGFENFTPRADSGAAITYQLKGSANGNDWANVGAEVSDIANLAIPTSAIGTYNYFKVVTTATFPSAR